MNRNFLLAASVAALLGFAPPVSAAWWNPVSSMVGEFLSAPVQGVVKVPWFDPCPSYNQYSSAAEKEKVLAMAKVAGDCYLDKEVERGPGYEYIKSGSLVDGLRANGFSVDPETGEITKPGANGFAAVLYQGPGGTTVLAFRGTEAFVDWDGLADYVQVTGSESSQYTAAAKLLGVVLANQTGSIEVTGHSLGGGLTQYAMAMNDLQGRVKGYTFNSAGLSDDTIASLPSSGIAAAGAALVNVRNDGDPVSFVASHIGNMFDIDNDSLFSMHSIKTVEANLMKANDPPVIDGPGLSTYNPARDTVAGATGGGEFLESLFGGEWTSFLPSDLTSQLYATLDQYVRLAILQKAGVQGARMLARLESLKKKLYSLLPDDASCAAFDGLVSDVLSGNWDHLGESSKNAAYAVSDFYIDKGLREAGVGKDERAAILKTYHEAADAWFAGGDVSGAISGNLESYVYGKIRDEVGGKAADSWKDVWSDLKKGTDPWENFGKATLDTIEFVGMRELADRLDAGFASLAKHCPWLAEFCGMCGIDKDSVMVLANNIWGVARGNGTVAEKLERTAEVVAEQLYEWFANFVGAAVEKLLDVVCAAVEWLSKEIHKPIEKLYREVSKLHGKGFHPQFTELVEYANKVREAREETAVLVTDFGTDPGMVPVSGGAVEAGSANMEVVHDEAF